MCTILMSQPPAWLAYHFDESLSACLACGSDEPHALYVIPTIKTAIDITQRQITMETECISVCQLGMDKSVLVKSENGELCVIVASTKEMQKYIKLTPNRSVLLL